MKLSLLSLARYPATSYAQEIYEHFKARLETKEQSIVRQAAMALVEFKIDEKNKEIEIAEALRNPENSKLLENADFRLHLDKINDLLLEKKYLNDVMVILENEAWEVF